MTPRFGRVTCCCAQHNTSIFAPRSGGLWRLHKITLMLGVIQCECVCVWTHSCKLGANNHNTAAIFWKHKLKTISFCLADRVYTICAMYLLAEHALYERWMSGWCCDEVSAPTQWSTLEISMEYELRFGWTQTLSVFVQRTKLNKKFQNSNWLMSSHPPQRHLWILCKSSSFINRDLCINTYSLDICRL